jgi:hypothetical protein
LHTLPWAVEQIKDIHNEIALLKQEVRNIKADHSEMNDRETDNNKTGDGEADKGALDNDGETSDGETDDVSHMHSHELLLYVEIAGLHTWVGVGASMPARLKFSQKTDFFHALEKLSMLCVRNPQNEGWNQSLRCMVIWAGKIRKGIDEGPLNCRLGTWAALWSQIHLTSGHSVQLLGGQNGCWLVSYDHGTYLIPDKDISMVGSEYMVW